MALPRHIAMFRDALIKVRPVPIKISIPGVKGGVEAVPGKGRPAYLERKKRGEAELEGRHEYTVLLADDRWVDVSVQLHLSGGIHWRLFAYSVANGNQNSGMLFSLNLTLGRGRDYVALKQRLRLSTRKVETTDRSQAARLLAARLGSLGLSVSEERDIVFPSFDTRRGVFVGASAASFLKDFLVTAIVKGHYMANKGYELPGLERMATPELSELVSPFDPDDFDDTRKKTLAEVVHRPEQAAFRRALLKAYNGRCAVTGCNVKQTLTAAHIIPHRGGRTDVVQNGLLLRADIHLLFDARLLAVDAKTMTLRIAPVLKNTIYQEYQNKPIKPPADQQCKPSQAALEIHRKAAGL